MNSLFYQPTVSTLTEDVREDEYDDNDAMVRLVVRSFGHSWRREDDVMVVMMMVGWRLLPVLPTKPQK